MHMLYIFLLCQGGKRPLMVALSEGHGNVVEVLLKKGANHSQPDMVGAMIISLPFLDKFWLDAPMASTYFSRLCIR